MRSEATTATVATANSTTAAPTPASTRHRDHPDRAVPAAGVASNNSPLAVTIACHTTSESAVRTFARIAPCPRRRRRAWATSTAVAADRGSASSSPSGTRSPSISAYSAPTTTSGQGKAGTSHT